MKKFLNYCLMLAIGILLLNCMGSNNGNGEPIPLVSTDNDVSVSMEAGSRAITNNATNVSLIPIISLKFSHPINPDTINSSKIILSSNPKQTTHDIAISNFTLYGNNQVATFTPAETLKPKTTYYLSLTNDVKAENGKPVKANQFQFTTSNYIKPMVSLISPQNNALDVTTHPTISLVFSEAVINVNPSTISLNKGTADGSPLAIQITAGAYNNYVITTSQQLSDNTDYYLSLSNKITNFEGNSLEAISFKFTTGNLSSPSVELVNILNGSTSVTSNNTKIKLQFSEEVTNVNTSTITLHENALDGAPVDIKISHLGNNQYQITPLIGFLKQNTNYYISLESSITDEKNHQLPPTNFSFTTRKAYAYILNESTTPTLNKCQISNDNLLHSCVIIANNLSHNGRIVINDAGTMAYLTNNYYVTTCTISENDGSFNNCSHHLLNVPLASPYGMAISKSQKHLFIVNTITGINTTRIKRLITCPLTENGNLRFDACTNNNLPDAISNEELLTISLNNEGNRVYFSRKNGGSGDIVCIFNGETLDSILYCSYSTSGLSTIAKEIVFNKTGTFAYQILKEQNKINRFSIDSLSGRLQVANSYFGYTAPDALAISADGLMSYVTHDANSVTQCSIDPSNGEITTTDCSNLIGFTNPKGIILRY